MALRISVLQGYPSGQDKPPVDIGLPGRAVGSYSSGPPSVRVVGTKSTADFHQ